MAIRKIKKDRERRDEGNATTFPTDDDSTLVLDFDTGSSDLWVFSTETAPNEVSGQSEYSPSKSSTSKKLAGVTWSIQYGDGSSSSGDVYTDKVTVGGLTVNAQAVGAARTVSDSFTSESDLDGLLGLGFSSINTVQPKQQKTFFDNAMPQLDFPVFTADLRHDAPGFYNFGFIGKSSYTGEISYTDIDNSQGWWQFMSSGYAVGGGSVSSSPITGIADTGTTLLLLPSTVTKAYYTHLKGAGVDALAGGYVFSCAANLPTFTFGVGDAEFTILAAFLNYAPLEEGSSTCFGGRQSSDEVGVNIFGDIALKAGFVVFDGGNVRLGWAKKSLA
ncbi:hypothetical protein QQZ08_010544 [Neonectria magnoliae]|uniref:Peptidase A1 domain-containing protein n=1 Tax=Neonectria magnoliae TaxID=2732573 RepID=A0ABR1HG80_9HYPO